MTALAVTDGSGLTMVAVSDHPYAHTKITLSKTVVPQGKKGASSQQT